MTAIAPDLEQLQMLDADTRRAWRAYSKRTEGLYGEEYEHAEDAAWTELQGELRRLGEQREALGRRPG
ncbi:MAG: hypothetical protein JO372_13655 [Solirubrobacterales bacterium]|nr:hypothetical protein [Solirubrobacterales bacterium]